MAEPLQDQEREEGAFSGAGGADDEHVGDVSDEEI
jgi:hypothetical protein